MAEHFTIGDIARLFSVTHRQANYAIERARVEPMYRAGVIRVFDFDRVEAIHQSLIATGAIRHNRGGDDDTRQRRRRKRDRVGDLAVQ